MTFALTIAHMKEMLQQPGCPICRLAHGAAQHSVASFLWENVNDPDARKEIIASYGFCPEHTRLLVAKELMESATVLGVNLIYEQLDRLVAKELQSLVQNNRSGRPMGAVFGSVRQLFQKFGWTSGSRPAAPVLPAQGICPICSSTRQAALNGLANLWGELDRQTEEFQQAYLASDGVCLDHLRQGIRQNGKQFPFADEFILKNAADQLQRRAVHMQEYIRKTNWEYREEKMTREESEAWRETLTFFTGLPGYRFTHKMDEF